jgi:PEGA domain-containing protein
MIRVADSQEEDDMSRYLKLSATALTVLLAFAIFAPVASARPGVVFRGYFGPGFYGPAWYGPAWYGPGWYAPYGYAPGPAVGSVKIDSKMKDTAVYVDGGYAGTVGQLKTFPLRPGTHDIELRDHEGHSFYQERIDVIAGKTIKLTPDIG